MARRDDQQPTRIVWGRFLTLLLVWLCLTGGALKDLPVGLLAAVLGAWASAKLLPQPLGEPNFLASARFILTFLRQAVMAGFDVARRAFDPKLPLKVGFAEFTPRLAPGVGRSLFSAFASMAPGTLPAGATPNGGILVHCLDTDIDVPAQMAEDEARLLAAMGKRPGHV